MRNNVRVAERRVDLRTLLGLWRGAQVCFTMLGILLCGFIGSIAAPQLATKNVLIIFGTTERYRANWAPIEPLIRTRVPVPVNFYHAYLEESREEDKSYLNIEAETFRRTYVGVKLDLVIAANPEELQFAVQYRNKVFPGVPIVFTGVSTRELEGQKMWPGVTGVTVPVGLRETIDLALRLQPDTSAVAVLTGVSSEDRYWLAVAHAELLRHQDKVREIDLVGPANDEMLERVAALPPNVVILFRVAPVGSTRPAFGPEDLLAVVAQRLPTYSAWPTLCHDGCIGGAYEDTAKEILQTGEIAARLLSGEQPENIPIVHATDLQVQVDWRALERWHIPDSVLPPGSVVLHREPTLWQRGRKYFLAAIMVIVVQALLIFGLFWQRARRRKAEAILRDSEERFRLAARAGKMFAYEWDAATDIIHRSPEFVQVLGFDGAKQTTGRQILDQVRAEDRERVLSALAELSPAKPDLRISFRMVRADGTTIWVERSSRAEFNDQGKLQRIVGMVADITERKHAEEQLQESEERFRLIATTAPVMIWMSGPDKQCTYFNQPWLTFTGRSIHQELGNGWAEGVHAEDLERCLATYNQAFDRREPFEMEYRLRRYDGEYRWVFDYGVPRFNADGSFAGYIGSASDLTDQKLAREALEKVSGQLIEAQEKERSRIARELHDDVCQRLAMLAIGIERVSQGSGSGRMPPARQLEQIWQHCSSLTGDVQALSHEHNPSILDNLGLVTAAKSFCRELSEEGEMNVVFTHESVPASLSREVSLSLFRVIQEAVHNAAKYSGERHFKVHLQGKPGEIELEVVDHGVGFDVESAKAAGLGLVSMAERINVLSGTFTIDSKPNFGTRICASVPLPAEAKVMAATAT